MNDLTDSAGALNGGAKWRACQTEMRHDAQKDEMQMNMSCNADEIKQICCSRSTMGRQTCKLVLVGIINLLTLNSIWANPAPSDPSNLSAVPVSSSQINLTWTDNA